MSRNRDARDRRPCFSARPRWLALGVAAAAWHAAAQEDPNLWLEDVTGATALEWVRAENARSLAVLEADPRFEAMRREALEILTSEARLPLGSIHNGAVYNFWQDETHVRGLWRRASVASYVAGAPEWEALLDYDALAAAENENWVAGRTVCLEPDYRQCMISMSYGGKDAVVWREFDTTTKRFVASGFRLPEAKTDLAWIDGDTLLVGTDLGAGSLTDSGYARTLVRLARGESLADARRTFEGSQSDVEILPRAERDGEAVYVFAIRATSFFEAEYYFRGDDAASGWTKLPLPLNADLAGVQDGRAIFFLREPWHYSEQTFAEGAIVAYDLRSGRAESVFEANARQAVQNVELGRSGLVVEYLEDVSGRAARVVRDSGGRWRAEPIALPDRGVVKIVSAGGGTDDVLATFESLTTPNALHYVRAGETKSRVVAAAPAFYDAADIRVEQRFATSRDGTRVPYFIAGRNDVLEAGNAPTMQYGYGGFLVSTLPVYYEDPGRPQHGALAGKIWLARGGVLVLSNIRGGAEYGPAWHKAAMQERHQNAIDDFIAISAALIDSGVTSPDKLGAIGRSNGGLLMGAVLTQRPELYAAIDCGVPLFDMRRYTKLGAGASWIGEYGDPDKPEDWAYIGKYSPYQNLRAERPYPEVFFYTSTQDDRVHPGHARKAAARMAELGYPYLYYENTEGGHGGTANQEQLAYRTALEFAYFARKLMPSAERRLQAK